MEQVTKNNSKAITIIKRVLIAFGLLLTTLLLTILIYVIIISTMYYRIGNTQVETKYNKESSDKPTLKLGESYKALTYNIGFGAYSLDFDFFMDGGKGSVAKNIETVIYNTNGVAEIINKLDADFVLMQELDIDSTRSKYQNQFDLISNQVNGIYQTSYASNFHSAFLMFPPFNPHGRVEGGLVTFSKYAQTRVDRYELEVDTTWPLKLFDLDRCYTVSRMPVENKELILVNLHLTAFEEKGIRAKQLEQLKNLLIEEKNKDNYVIIGGDFNHDLIVSLGEEAKREWALPINDYEPEKWISYIHEDFIKFLNDNNYSFSIPFNEPTCRSSKYSYNEVSSDKWTIDGYIVSSNIEIINCEVPFINQILGNNDKYSNFLYSDHNPVALEFMLK